MLYFHFILAGKPLAGKQLTVKNLINATKKCVDWYQLGIQLDFETSDLNKIKKNNHDVDSARINLFTQWIENGQEPSWSKLIEALKAMDFNNLSNDILLKYGGGMLYIILQILQGHKHI